MPANHADTRPLSRRIGGTIRQAGVMGLLTNANVAAADTLDGLDAAMLTVNNGLHADQRGFMGPAKAAIRKDQNLTNANVLGLTTVEGLVNLTDLGTEVRYDQLGE